MSIYELVNQDVWLTGFSLRQAPNRALANEWDSKRRAKYLLREDVPIVLAFDDAIWPACGTQAERDKLFEGNLSQIAGPDGCDYFDELMSLRGDGLGHPPGCVLVAAVSPRSRKVLEQTVEVLRRAYESAVRPLSSPSWAHLGFDIVESCLGISGLSNTSYSKSDLSGMKVQFAGLINSYGLLPDLGIALEVASKTTARTPEHAPYLPVSLFALGEMAKV